MRSSTATLGAAARRLGLGLALPLPMPLPVPPTLTLSLTLTRCDCTGGVCKQCCKEECFEDNTHACSWAPVKTCF